jgi:hypothetical protein
MRIPIPNLASIAPEDLPFYAFQKRFSAGELATPDLNDQNRRLFGLPSQVVQREAFVAVGNTPFDGRPDSHQGDRAEFIPGYSPSFRKWK